MLHPSYSDLMKVVNSEVEVGDQPLVQSRYSIVMATAKRARQIIDGEEPLVEENGKKPLSMAVEELNIGDVRIISEEEAEEIAKLNEERNALNAVTAAKIAERQAAEKAAREAEEAEKAEDELNVSEESAEDVVEDEIDDEIEDEIDDEIEEYNEEEE